MYPYTIDDEIHSSLQACVEVTIAFPSGPRWLFFVTPDHLKGCGDIIDGSTAKIHLGELHLVVVSEISEAIIESALRQLEKEGELERRTLALR